MVNEGPILIKETKHTAVITLNRPKSLNAVNQDLLNELLNALKKFEEEKCLIIIKATGRAFCAGGDLLSAPSTDIHEDNALSVLDFCLKTYEFFFILNTYRTAVIVLVNGLAFGAGASITALSEFSIVTEKAVFSMPETKFAFHPNCGASYFLNRTKGQLGHYMGLTGESLKGADIVSAGFAKYFCHSNHLERLESELLNCSNRGSIIKVIENISEKSLPALSVGSILDNINICFTGNTVEDIISLLRNDGSDWGKKTASTLERYSPSSLKVTLRQLQISKNMSLLECFTMESNISCNFLKFQDIYEGALALLVDRSHVPQWNPSKLSYVSEELIQEYFESSADKALTERLRNRCSLLNNNLKNKL